MNAHLMGLMITTLGVLLVVPDSLYVRLIDAEPLVISFWRALTAGGIILILVALFQGLAGFRALLGTGWAGGLYIVLMATTPVGFVLAISLTSVANVVFILASAPIFAAIFSRIFLGEPIKRRIVCTMGVVLLGLGVIAYGSKTDEIAHWSGDLWAVYSAAAYAAALTAVRRVKAVSMVPAIPIAYIGAALVISLFTDPLPAFEGQWQLFIGHGVFVGLASCLLTLGPRYISSAEVSLLILLESVLAPILVWYVIGEDPGPLALVGGAVVIGALVASNLIALRAHRRARA